MAVNPTIGTPERRMTIGIMQPYFFPYIGYFQLIAQSDAFIFHDDVQYIKGGWINRNRILRDGAPRWINFPVTGASHTLPINQRNYQLTRRNVTQILRAIESSYRKAPHFKNIFPLLRQIISYDDPNIASFNINLISRLAVHLQINKNFLRSSELVTENRRCGQERVVHLCQQLGATDYVNPIGGKELYQPKSFKDAGINLKFLESTPRSYQQFGQITTANLSIVDVMMFNSQSDIATMLTEYQLIE